MAKMKKPSSSDTCPEAIFPLGKGLPLCMFDICREHRIHGVKLQDIPMCGLSKFCYKVQFEQKRMQEEQNKSVGAISTD